MSANATNTCHLENPVGPRRTRRARPHHRSRTHLCWKEFYCIWSLSISHSYAPLFSFFSTSRYPFALSLFTLAPLPLINRRRATAFAFTLLFPPLLFPLTHLAHRVLDLSLLAYINRLAWPRKRRAIEALNPLCLSGLRLPPNSLACTNQIRYIDTSRS